MPHLVHDIGGHQFLENKHLTKPGPARKVRRSWRERLFTLPWMPFKRHRWHVVQVPDPRFYRVGPATFVAHPETIANLATWYREQERNGWPVVRGVIEMNSITLRGHE